MRNRRFLSFLITCAMCVALLISAPLPALAERVPIDFRIEYSTGEIDGNGQEITMYAEPNIDYQWSFADAALTVLWIETSDTFWQDPVRIIAVFDDMGITEMYPFTDAYGNEWLSLTGSEAISFSAQVTADGTLLLAQRLIMSPLSQAEYEFETGTTISGGEGYFPSAGGEDYSYTPPGDGGEGFPYSPPGDNGEDFSYTPQNDGGDDYSYTPQSDGGEDFSYTPQSDGGDDYSYTPQSNGGEESLFSFGGSNPQSDIGADGTDEDYDQDFTGPNAPLPASGGISAVLGESGFTALSAPEINPVENNPAEPPTYESVYGHTLSEVTALVTDPSPDGLKMIDLPLGTYVRLSDMVENPVIEGDGGYWLAVTLDADPYTTGYIFYDADSFAFLTPQEETAYLNSVQEQLPSGYSDLLNVTGGGVTLYGSVNGMSVSEAPQGTKLVTNITAATPLAWDSSHRLWIPVYVEGDPTTSGYILYARGTAGAQLMTAAEKETYEKSKIPVENEQFPSTPESNFGRAKENGTTVYSDINGQNVGTVGINDVLIMKETEQSPIKWDADGKMWIPVESYDGTVKGYLRMTSFTFYTAAQEKAFVDSMNPVETPTDEPVPFYESLYAQVTSIGTTLHARDLTQTGTLAGGAYVVFQASAADQAFVDGNHNRWLLVKLDDSNTTGYVRNSAITFLTKSQETTYLNGKSTVPAADTSKYAYVNARSVNVRSAPSSSARITEGVTQGDAVFLSDLTTAADGTKWYHATLIEKSGTPKPTGYIRSDMVEIMSEAQEVAYLKAHPQGQPEPTVTATPTLPPQVAGYMRSNAQNVPMVSFPSVGGIVASVLDLNSVVYVYWQEHDESNNLFHYAYNFKDGKFGYVLSRYLTAMTTQEANNYLQSQKPTTAPTTAPTYTPSSFSGYALLTSNKVNFRSSASTSNNVITQLSQGTIVRVLSETTAEGYTWYRCESGGSTGYLRADMLSMLSISEYQTIVSLPSYSSSGGAIITPTATANTGSVNAGTWATQRPSVNSTITFVTIPPSSTADPSTTADPSASPDPSTSADPSESPGATDSLLGDTGTPEPNPDVTLAPPEPDATFPTQETSGFSASSLLVALVVLLVITTGGFYGYSVYNKAHRKQAQDQSRRLAEEARRKARQSETEGGAKPAVRRPVPPATPGAPGAAKPGDPTKPTASVKPGDPARPGVPAKPGTPGATATPTAGQANRPGTAQQNPYMRPQGQQPTKPPVQDVASAMPRAQVDGKPVDGSAGKSAEARPGGVRPPAGTAPTATGAQAPGRRPGVTQPANAQPGSATSSPQNPYARPPESAAPARPRMPIAPAPVEPDGEPAPTPRRRRRHTETDQTNNDA